MDRYKTSYPNVRYKARKKRKKFSRYLILITLALALVLSLGIIIDAHAGSMPSKGFNVGTVIGTKLKSEEQQDWSEGIFQVGSDNTWVYCVELMAHYNGSNVSEGDALGFISQDNLTKVALADEYIWTVTSEFSNNYQKYYMSQQAIWLLLADEQGYASKLDWVGAPKGGLGDVFYAKGGTDSDPSAYQNWWNKTWWPALSDYVNSNFSGAKGYGKVYSGAGQHLGGHFWLERSGKITLTKVSKHPNKTNNEPLYSLEGATYSVFSDSSCKTQIATMVTDSSGYAISENIPIGNYWVKETSPSTNYQLDEKIYAVKVESGKTTSIEGGVSIEPYNTGFISLKKQSLNEEMTNENDNYSLTGAIYGIYKNSKCTELVQKITTDKSGFAKSSELILSNYWVKEITAPLGYATDLKTYKVSFGLYDAGKTLVVNTVSGGVVKEVPQNNLVDIIIQKHDTETKKPLPLGSATLKGAHFSIKFYNSKSINDGQKPVRTWLFETDNEGKIDFANAKALDGSDDFFFDTTKKRTLPLGIVQIQEIKAPKGYLINNEVKTIAITSKGEAEHVETFKALIDSSSVNQQVKRGDLEFVKVGSDEMQRLKNVAFMIRSKTTGEEHVIVTDDNGQIKTENEWNAHSQNTNANDVAVSKNEDGTYSIDETKLKPESGIWFGVDSEGEKAHANDELGALPYDTYEVEELPCKANENYNKVKFVITITRDKVSVDSGTVEDHPIEISTTLVNAATKQKTIENEAKKVKLTDIVYYSGLKVGKEYVFSGTLKYAKENNKGQKIDDGEVLDSKGNVLTSEVKFRPTQTQGTVEVPFDIDLANINNRSLVAFEKCTLEEKTIAEHGSIDNENQTVTLTSNKKVQEEPEEEEEVKETQVEKTPETKSAATKQEKQRQAQNAPLAKTLDNLLPIIIGAIVIAITCIGLIAFAKSRRKKKKEDFIWKYPY